MKRELARMTEECTSLKKAIAYLARESSVRYAIIEAQVRYAFIEAHRAEFFVRLRLISPT